MESPILLLQSGDYMQTEKLACAFSDYDTLPVSFERLKDFSVEHRIRGVPVGTVEYVQRWCELADICLPSSLSYPQQFHKYLHRKVRSGSFWEASLHEFVKPGERVKAFTGGIKGNITEPVDRYEPVWISECVPFESEFRFYIHDFVNGPKIWGWARYDELPTSNPEPDFDLVEAIAQEYHDDLGPLAYSVDIGWRPDLQRYALVEINDAWALGLYENTDPQSNPPTRQQYADMIVNRWRQILFCNLV